MATNYMSKLYSQLIDVRKTTDTTAREYIRRLVIANCDKPFDSLTFLNNKSKVMECLAPYKPNTQKGVLTAIVSVARMIKNNALADKYYKDMVEGGTPPSNDKTDVQKTNWIEWDEVMQIKTDMHKNMKSWEDRLRYFLLCLYTDTPPRRNVDYLKMDVIQKYHDDLPKTKNYLALQDNQMIFNVYKTAKHYGQQRIELTPELRVAVDEYIKHHPLKKMKQFPLLVNTFGGAYQTSAAITIMLNRIFKKKVGASMLRHIFLSNKYGSQLNEMKKDAALMAHSVQEAQETYIKN